MKEPTPSRPLKLRILDKEVQIACRPGEEEDLLQAAAYIDDSMRDLRRKSHTSSIEKIAIAAAINTANALLKARAGQSRSTVDKQAADESVSGSDERAVSQRIASLNERLDGLLTDAPES